AGTPVLDVTAHHDAEARTCTLTVRQSCPPTPRQPDKQPLHIPLTLALLGPDGRHLPLRLADETPPTRTERVCELREPVTTLTFADVPERPVPSLLRGFSAPVRLRLPLTAEEPLLLAARDDDPLPRRGRAQGGRRGGRPAPTAPPGTGRGPRRTPHGGRHRPGPGRAHAGTALLRHAVRPARRGGPGPADRCTRPHQAGVGAHPSGTFPRLSPAPGRRPPVRFRGGRRGAPRAAEHLPGLPGRTGGPGGRLAAAPAVRDGRQHDRPARRAHRAGRPNRRGGGTGGVRGALAGSSAGAGQVVLPARPQPPPGRPGPGPAPDPPPRLLRGQPEPGGCAGDRVLLRQP